MTRRIIRIFAAVAILFLTAGAASAQWLNIPLAGTPRTPDGKPNLSAPAPKTSDGKPDLSGIWNAADGKWLRDLASDEGEAPFQPWAAAVYKERVENLAKDRPSGRCLPHAIPDSMTVRSGPWKIIQNSNQLAILFEEMNHYRQIFTDGRSFPKQMAPTWWGYSIGKWEGDTLVVDTLGFNDQSWLDDPGHPHSDAMHVTERFHRVDFGHLDIQITIDDKKTYTRPWTASMHFNLLPDQELLESICENEKDYEHTLK
jgi:hypothetical protein